MNQFRHEHSSHVAAGQPVPNVVEEFRQFCARESSRTAKGAPVPNVPEESDQINPPQSANVTAGEPVPNVLEESLPKAPQLPPKLEYEDHPQLELPIRHVSDVPGVDEELHYYRQCYDSTHLHTTRGVSMEAINAALAEELQRAEILDTYRAAKAEIMERTCGRQLSKYNLERLDEFELKLEDAIARLPEYVRKSAPKGFDEVESFYVHLPLDLLTFSEREKNEGFDRLYYAIPVFGWMLWPFARKALEPEAFRTKPKVTSAAHPKLKAAIAKMHSLGVEPTLKYGKTIHDGWLRARFQS